MTDQDVICAWMEPKPATGNAIMTDSPYGWWRAVHTFEGKHLVFDSWDARSLTLDAPLGSRGAADRGSTMGLLRGHPQAVGCTASGHMALSARHPRAEDQGTRGGTAAYREGNSMIDRDDLCRFCGNEGPHGVHTSECPTRLQAAEEEAWFHGETRLEGEPDGLG